MKYDLVLIGYEEGENLGLRYITSYLSKHGVNTIIIPYEPSLKNKIIRLIKEYEPKIVGFSLIFQRMLDDFNDLIINLKNSGITSHFTMGGHFPSVEPKKVLEKIQELDSIVRCEGELTLFELFGNVNKPEQWKNIDGLVYRHNGEIIINKYRDLIKDLDDLPFPERLDKPYSHRDFRMSSILSSRGCNYNCCFCSIHEFYKESKGKNRRRRSPGNVIKEIVHLYNTHDIKIFIFEDDDFPLKGKQNQEWILEFISGLEESGLHKKIVWRISTRIDEVDKDMLKLLKQNGLISVYLGIESGNDYSLKLFKKRYTVQDIYDTLDIFTELDLPYEFGFMVLHPDCSFETIEADLVFLKNISHSGLANVHFTKMLPYAGTQIEKQLLQEGRLTGNICYPDYNFRDSRIDYYQLFLTRAFHQRNFAKDGLVENLRLAKFDRIILSAFDNTYNYEQNDKLKDYIRLSNYIFIEKSAKALAFMKNKSLDEILDNWGFLEELIVEGLDTENEINKFAYSIIDA